MAEITRKRTPTAQQDEGLIMAMKNKNALSQMQAQLSALQTTVLSLYKALTGVRAEGVIQDLTYCAVIHGKSGSDITVEYTGGATAGSEDVSVAGHSTITVQIESGVSTADQIKAAVDAHGPCKNLVKVVLSGTGSNTQTTQSETNLTGGVGSLNPGKNPMKGI